MHTISVYTFSTIVEGNRNFLKKCSLRPVQPNLCARRVEPNFWGKSLAKGGKSLMDYFGEQSKLFKKSMFDPNLKKIGQQLRSQEREYGVLKSHA